MSLEFTATIIGATATIIAAILAALLTVFGRDAASKFFPSESRELFKFMHITVIHLSRQAPGASPIYKRYIPRLDESVDVFDEVHVTGIHIFNKQLRNLEVKDRSSGVTDMQLIYPRRDLQFDDPGETEVRNLITQKIPQPTSTIITETVRINGIQEGQEYCAVRMDLPTDNAILIVDFTSIPNISAVLNGQPTSIVRNERDHTQRGVGVVQLADGSFSVDVSNLSAGDVIEMHFKIAWPAVDQKLHMVAA